MIRLEQVEASPREDSGSGEVRKAKAAFLRKSAKRSVAEMLWCATPGSCFACTALAADRSKAEASTCCFSNTLQTQVGKVPHYHWFELSHGDGQERCCRYASFLTLFSFATLAGKVDQSVYWFGDAVMQTAVMTEFPKDATNVLKTLYDTATINDVYT